MMEQDQKRELTRDLLAKVRTGQITPAEADTEAFFAGIGSLSRIPSLDEYCPTSKRHWTLPMVLAWIAWRTFSEVREWDADYLPLRLDWGRVENNGLGLFTRRRPTSAQFLKWGKNRLGPWLKGRDGHPAALSEATPAEAMALMRRSLEGGELIAHGVPAAGAPRVEIPSREWIDLELVVRPDGDEEVRCGVGSRRIVYWDVLLPQRLVLELWPQHRRSGLPERHDPGLTRIEDREAWSALYAESASPEFLLFGEPKPRGIMDHDLPDLCRANKMSMEDGSGPLTSEETYDWAAKRGLSRESARTLRDDLPEELKRNNGERRR